MTSSWVLLLTDDPRIRAAVVRLAEQAAVGVRPAAAGLGRPDLVLLGADRVLERALPAEASGVPRLLVSHGEPTDQFWRAAVELRVDQVVLLPEAEHLLAQRLSRIEDQRSRHAVVIAVIGGCGGAGASVLAAALGRVAARITPSLLIDVDRLGSGADLMLGAEDEPGLRWPDLASVRGRLLPGTLNSSLPVIDGLHVLSWDRSTDLIDLPVPAATAVIEAARQEYGVVVLDLPRAPDPAVDEMLALADLGLLVVPAEVRAAAAARRVMAAIRTRPADVRLVVRGPGPTGLRPEAISAALDLPLGAGLRPEPGLRVALDRGEPPGLQSRGPLAVFCRALLTEVLANRGRVGGGVR